MRLIAFVVTGLLTFGGTAYGLAPQINGPPERANKPCDRGRQKPASYSVQPSDSVSDPTVTGPTSGGIRTGKPYGTTMVPLEKGWVEEEFFFEGTTRTYATETPQQAQYKSRILVRRPTDPKEFNGSVIVDWNNVTIPADRDVGWSVLHDAIMERGYVYVSVAAQRLSIEASPLALKQWDPARYGSLSHPGDDYSFDIFSQAAEAVLDDKVLDELRPCVERRLAMGASQSASRLKTYINSVQEHSGIFDGFMPQIIGAEDVRRDLIPVLWVNSMAEIDESEPIPADSGLFRLWEIAGAAHTSNNSSTYHDQQLIYNHSNGNAGAWDKEAANTWGYLAQPGDCLTRNWYQAGLIWSAALIALDEWVETGMAPAPMPRAARDQNGELVWDEHGNLKGGVRTPILDVPIATYFAGITPAPTTDPCGVVGGHVALSGFTRVFSADKLAQLYASGDDFLQKFHPSVDSALANGYILPSDAERLRERGKDAARFVSEAIN